MAAIQSSVAENETLPQQKHAVRTTCLTQEEWEVQLSGLLPSTKRIVANLLAEGIPWNEIILPGSGKGMILELSPDFDEPMEEFAEYMR